MDTLIRNSPSSTWRYFGSYEKRAREAEKRLWAEESLKAISIKDSKSAPETDINVDGEMTVYVTKSGKKYHRELPLGECGYEFGKGKGELYAVCKCNPPK